jgi:protoporphyrinogen/coproporphyrinogen III oxidase
MTHLGHIIVIGGGAAGTGAARSLVKLGYKVTIVEKDSRLGGRIYSETIGDLTSEMGAGFLTEIYTNTLVLLEEAGLTHKLHERKSGAAIMRDGTPHSLAKWSTYLGSSWLSLGARLRLVSETLRTLGLQKELDMHDIWRADRFDNESITEHFSGKYGQELVDYTVGPAIDSYLYWSPERTSYALAKALLAGGSSARQKHTYVLQDGLSQIPQIAAQGSKILLGHEVLSVVRLQGGAYEATVRSKRGQQKFKADGIVCATTASVIPKMIKDLTPEQKTFFSSIHYSSTAVVTYRLERNTSPHTYAIAYPRKEGLPLTAMTVLSDLSPKADVVKLYASGVAGKELCKKSDKAIESTLSSAVSLNFEAARKSGKWRVQRWAEALPEFEVGSLKQLRTFVDGEIEAKNEPLVFAGDYIGGPFIEGALTSGMRAAKRLDKVIHAGTEL